MTGRQINSSDNFKIPGTRFIWSVQVSREDEESSYNEICLWEFCTSFSVILQIEYRVLFEAINVLPKETRAAVPTKFITGFTRDVLADVVPLYSAPKARPCFYLSVILYLTLLHIGQ
jgi:hypothetical protein